MNPSTQEQDMLNVHEVATLFRVSHMTIYRLVNSGELTAIRVGRSFRIPRESVEEYAAAHPGSTASAA